MNDIPLLSIRGLSKRFGVRTVLEDLDLELHAGVHWLTGANGAGKSTLLALLAGSEPPDAGAIRIAGHDLCAAPQTAKRLLGWQPDAAEVYGFLTGRELLQIVAAAKQVKDTAEIESLLARLQLTDLQNRRFDEMSLGMQRKFMLVAAWIGRPKLLLLDEPANGLDAAALAELDRMILEVSRQACVLFASHETTLPCAAGASRLHLADGKLYRGAPELKA
jgi:ABC-type multidrug transport system ATPase subunit